VLEFQNQLSQVTYNKKNIYKMKKIVRLTENDLVRIVKRIISEQPKGNELDKVVTSMLSKGPKPTEPGAKYCFTKEDLKKDIELEGSHNIRIYKIKKGDTPDTIKRMTDQVSGLSKMNPRCDMNKPKLNDVILVSKLPGQ
jgi:hypothetical protein